MKLAICDDQENVLPILQQQVMQLERVEMVTLFSDIKEFLYAVEKGKQFDVVLMDIEWEQDKNGIDFAQELYQKNRDIHIIYLTGYADQFMHAIFFKQANLSGYLAKPLQLAELELLLEKIYQQQVQGKNTLVVSYKKVTRQLLTKDIIYLESKAHLIHIYSEQGIYYCREKLDEIEKRLPDCFFRPHKSFLVNMDKIQRMDSKFVALQNGMEIAVSRMRYDIIKEQFFRYKGKKLEQQYFHHK